MFMCLLLMSVCVCDRMLEFLCDSLLLNYSAQLVERETIRRARMTLFVAPWTYCSLSLCWLPWFLPPSVNPVMLKYPFKYPFENCKISFLQLLSGWEVRFNLTEKHLWEWTDCYAINAEMKVAILSKAADSTFFFIFSASLSKLL